MSLMVIQSYLALALHSVPATTPFAEEQSPDLPCALLDVQVILLDLCVLVDG